jgi:hypothetical protein
MFGISPSDSELFGWTFQPGRYTLQVKAINGSDTFTSVAAFSVVMPRDSDAAECRMAAQIVSDTSRTQFLSAAEAFLENFPHSAYAPLVFERFAGWSISDTTKPQEDIVKLLGLVLPFHCESYALRDGISSCFYWASIEGRKQIIRRLRQSTGCEVAKSFLKEWRFY